MHGTITLTGLCNIKQILLFFFFCFFFFCFFFFFFLFFFFAAIFAFTVIFLLQPFLNSWMTDMLSYSRVKHFLKWKRLQATLREICITKTCPCNIQRIFSVPKIENFTRKMLIFFLFFAQNIDCGYMLEPPQRGGSNEYPQSMF